MGSTPAGCSFFDSGRLDLHYLPMTEVIFEVREDETEAGFIASSLGFGIHIQAETIDELHSCGSEAVECYFDDALDAPKLVRLQFVSDV